MKDLYICNTLYHALIAIIKAMKSPNESDLLVYQEGHYGNQITSELLKEIKKEKIFSNITVIYLNSYRAMVKKNKFKMMKIYLENYFQVKKDVKRVTFDFSLYQNIYIHLDVTWMGKILNKKKISYTILEDGTDCFKYYKQYHNHTWRWEYLEKLFYGYAYVGESKYCKSIVVNEIDGIDISYKEKLVEESKNELFSHLSELEKKRILKIFHCKNVFPKKKKKYTLLITQPLFIDTHLDTAKQMIDMYHYILDTYCQNENIIIKVHPKETVDYSKYFKDCIVITDKYPLELFNFYSSVQIEKAITVFSTAIQSLSFVQEKQVLGLEWFLQYKKEKCGLDARF